MPEPSKIPQAWAADGDYNVIPTTNPGTGLCSWPLGFPTETQTPIAAGGTPPRRQDMNGALNWLSQHLLWTQQGGLWQYDALEDYEIGNVVLQNNSLYYCIRANGPASTVRSPANDSAGTYWQALIYSTGKHPDPDHLANPAVLQVLQAVYPVGSIYCSYGNTSPATLFGFGQWTKIEGRFLLGANSTYSLGSTGGAATVALTVAQLPAHSHGASSASAGVHTHSITVNSAGAHTHTVSGTAESAGAHTHTASSASAGAHTHTVSGTAASGGAHTHTASSASAGAHTHTVSGTAADSGEHTHSVSGTAASGGAHTHTASSASAGAHTHTITVNSAGAHAHSASSASAGEHTHSRGTMNITGTFSGVGQTYTSPKPTLTGAFFIKNTVDHPIEGVPISNSGENDDYYGFDASRAWSGATSSNGAHTHTITVNSGGAHTHTASSASAGAHTHSITVNSGGVHTHTVSGTAADSGEHSHTVSGTAASAGAHTHSITVNSAGAHTHTVGGTAESAGAHTHSITINSAGAHTHTVSGTAESAGVHTHTASSASAGAHTHTITVSNTGSGQAHTNMPPYLAVNMWRRTA
jgi:hypothetical protein